MCVLCGIVPQWNEHFIRLPGSFKEEVTIPAHYKEKYKGDNLLGASKEGHLRKAANDLLSILTMLAHRFKHKL